MNKANVFHQHLDVCERCRENPMDLCAVGVLALQSVVNQNDLSKSQQKRIAMQVGRPTGRPE